MQNTRKRRGKRDKKQARVREQQRKKARAAHASAVGVFVPCYWPRLNLVPLREEELHTPPRVAEHIRPALPELQVRVR